MKQANLNTELSDHALAQVSAGLTLGGSQLGSNLAGDVVIVDDGPSFGEATPLDDPDHVANPGGDRRARRASGRI